MSSAPSPAPDVDEYDLTDAHTCPDNGTGYHGRCLGHCRECGCQLRCTGRYTTYCPDCDTCPTCHCPRADGFEHNAGCKDAPDEED